MEPLAGVVSTGAALDMQSYLVDPMLHAHLNPRLTTSSLRMYANCSLANASGVFDFRYKAFSSLLRKQLVKILTCLQTRREAEAAFLVVGVLGDRVPKEKELVVGGRL